MPTLPANEINIYYEQSGHGPDLVLVSGLSVDHTMWNVNQFSDRFRVLVFDNRGVGQTDTPEGPYNMSMFVGDTIALCNALGIKKAHFVGHSMGGHIAQYLAAHYPDRINKLVLACSEQIFSTISYFATKIQIELRKYHIPRKILIENYLPVLFSSTFLEDKNRIEAYIHDSLNKLNPQSDKGFIAQVEALRTHDTKDLLSKIHCPTLVIGCENDLLTPLENSKLLAKHIANATLEVIRDCGHAPFIEKPEEFYKIIRDFLIE